MLLNHTTGYGLPRSTLNVLFLYANLLRLHQPYSWQISYALTQHLRTQVEQFVMATHTSGRSSQLHGAKCRLTLCSHSPQQDILQVIPSIWKWGYRRSAWDDGRGCWTTNCLVCCWTPPTCLRWRWIIEVRTACDDTEWQWMFYSVAGRRSLCDGCLVEDAEQWTFWYDGCNCDDDWHPPSF